MIILFSDIFWEHLPNQNKKWDTWYESLTLPGWCRARQPSGASYEILSTVVPKWKFEQGGERRRGQPSSARSQGFLASPFDVLCLWSKSLWSGHPYPAISSLAPAVYQREESPLVITSLRESERSETEKEITKTRREWESKNSRRWRELECEPESHWHFNLTPWVRKIPLDKGMATHSSILAWRISWTEEPGGLQSTGSQRVGHDWSNLTCMHTHIYILVAVCNIKIIRDWPFREFFGGLFYTFVSRFLSLFYADRTTVYLFVF